MRWSKYGKVRINAYPNYRLEANTAPRANMTPNPPHNFEHIYRGVIVSFGSVFISCVKPTSTISASFLVNLLTGWWMFWGLESLEDVQLNIYSLVIQSMTPNCHTFFTKKLQKSVTVWEHLPKRYYFWTILKQKRKKSVTIWGHGLYYGNTVLPDWCQYFTLW